MRNDIYSWGHSGSGKKNRKDALKLIDCFKRRRYKRNWGISLEREQWWRGPTSRKNIVRWWWSNLIKEAIFTLTWLVIQFSWRQLITWCHLTFLFYNLPRIAAIWVNHSSLWSRRHIPKQNYSLRFVYSKNVIFSKTTENIVKLGKLKQRSHYYTACT